MFDVVVRMVCIWGGRFFVIMISWEFDEVEFLKVVEMFNYLFRVLLFEWMEFYVVFLVKRICGYVKEG